MQVLEACHAVHISIAGEAELPVVQNVVRSVDPDRLERISYISGCTVCEENGWFPMVAAKLQAERAIRESGIPYTIFAPSWPMEMLARYARDGKPMLIGRQTNPFHFFARADLARMVSAAYQTEAAANQRFTIHGPEGIPFKEALWRYCRTFHPEVEKIGSMPVWLVKVMAAVMRNDLMKFGADLAAYFDRVGELRDPQPANRLLGPPTRRLDQWLASRPAVR